jgi:hypothetical protein
MSTLGLEQMDDKPLQAVLSYLDGDSYTPEPFDPLVLSS